MVRSPTLRLDRWSDSRFSYPNQFGMRRTMADPCICNSATCSHLQQSTPVTRPHLQHVNMCNVGTSVASPEEPHFAKIVFFVKCQSILRTETGKMVSIANRTLLKRSQMELSNLSGETHDLIPRPYPGGMWRVMGLPSLLSALGRRYGNVSRDICLSLHDHCVVGSLLNRCRPPGMAHCAEK